MKVRYVVMLVVFLLAVGLTFGALGGVYIDRAFLNTGITSVATGIPTEALADFQLMGQAWSQINQVYVDRNALVPQTLTYGAISGMVDSLGDVGHSRFLSPDAVQAEASFNAGTLEGVGLEVQSLNGATVIVAPIDSSPAQQAGLRAGQIIHKVNGSDVSGLPLEQVVSMILGPAGTQVTLTITDPSTGADKDYTLTRAKITLVNVTWQQLPGTTVVHLRIAAFSQNVGSDVRNALSQILATSPSAIILDLRNNPGGFLNEAITTASQFLSSGDVLLVKNRAGNITRLPVERGGLATSIPMVTLINQGTASGAEIVAGALQDPHRSQMIGETTFGTGTVLNQYSLADGSALLLATEEWLTPAGRVIWHKGLEPDITVALPAGASSLVPESERSMTAAQLESSGDAQLLRAIQLLSSGK